eukprot:3591487-Rhodomonas_salina.1
MVCDAAKATMSTTRSISRQKLSQIATSSHFPFKHVAQRGMSKLTGSPWPPNGLVSLPGCVLLLIIILIILILIILIHPPPPHHHHQAVPPPAPSLAGPQACGSLIVRRKVNLGYKWVTF